ncbi:hypothetical protein WJX72_001786 [[Myrmecia] bisecta]|uniref:Small ubiquitin-related modifier n=1 Tax=[Myrmecia] bisecta TaxID=41462 RepID=A0AAW1P3L6_9CHLO
MADSGEDKKPDVSSTEHLNLKVRSQDGTTTFFKAKKTTKFSKLISAFCAKQSISEAEVVFMFDGERLRGEQTPEELDMQNDDTIDAMIHQVGG